MESIADDAKAKKNPSHESMRGVGINPVKVKERATEP
jgi:hypothetical protein